MNLNIDTAKAIIIAALIIAFAILEHPTILVSSLEDVGFFTQHK